MKNCSGSPCIPHPPAGKRLWRVLLWLTLFGISMGYFEAAVVADLRAIFCPDNKLFPLCVKSDRLGLIEIGREFFSIVMLVAVACLAGWEFKTRVASFAMLFGIWDVFFYVFLKLLIGWPASLLTWDLLFLIPVPWVAPVIAPVLVALTLISGGFMVLQASARGIAWRWNLWGGMGFLLAVFGILLSFCLDWRHIAGGGLPRAFPWVVFLAGELLLSGIIVYFYRISLSRALHESKR